jgi:hypothetical protein
MILTLYEKAAAIAIKLEELDPRAQFRPEFLLRKASAEEIDFYYERLCIICR